MTTTAPQAMPRTAPGRGRWIEWWEPEDERFWNSTGRGIARRNLIFSIFTEHLGFSVWLLWSVVAVSLPAAGFDFSLDQLFWLAAVPNLVGSFMRIPYTAAVGAFGGRNWTTISAALLLIPIGLMTWCLTNKDAASGYVVWSDTTPKLRSGPHSYCGLVSYLPGGTKLYYHCYTTNEAGNTWTHARRAGTDTQGWIWFGYLDDGGSYERC